MTTFCFQSTVNTVTVSMVNIKKTTWDAFRHKLRRSAFDSLFIYLTFSIHKNMHFICNHNFTQDYFFLSIIRCISRVKNHQKFFPFKSNVELFRWVEKRWRSHWYWCIQWENVRLPLIDFSYALGDRLKLIQCVRFCNELSGHIKYLQT